MSRFLTALPVYNEAKSLRAVLKAVVKNCDDILVVNDGSTDGSGELLAAIPGVSVIHHEINRGYGAALVSAFDYAIENGYEGLVTIDCDGQHEPGFIRSFAAQLFAGGADIISGSRYLEQISTGSVAPIERRRINFQITQFLNARLGLNLTDAFCGFKAYRVSSLKKFNLTEPGYAMPLELWVQAACHSMRVEESPVPLIYLDEKRSFGGNLDDGDTRLKYYLDVIERSLAAMPDGCPKLKST
jgi:dolichol-phosphate mannosyltransferase